MNQSETLIHRANGIIAFAGSLIWAVLSIAFVVGGILIAVVFRVIEVPLRSIGFILDQRRLRRVAAVIGLAMITASYIIRMAA